MSNKPQTIEEARQAAYARLAEVPEGTHRENYLPFVEAVCYHLELLQMDALERDHTADSFTAAAQQILYWQDYERLTGLKWGEREKTLPAASEAI